MKGGEKMDKILRQIEVERIQNIAKGFGWSLEGVTEENNTLTINLKKTIGQASVEQGSPTSV